MKGYHKQVCFFSEINFIYVVLYCDLVLREINTIKIFCSFPDPLPDIILDFFRYQYWALTASEVLLSIQSVTAVLICIFHKHRQVFLYF